MNGLKTRARARPRAAHTAEFIRFRANLFCFFSCSPVDATFFANLGMAVKGDQTENLVALVLYLRAGPYLLNPWNRAICQENAAFFLFVAQDPPNVSLNACAVGEVGRSLVQHTYIIRSKYMPREQFWNTAAPPPPPLVMSNAILQ